MIPNSDKEIEIVSYPTLTYGLNFATQRIDAFIDNKEGLRQSIYLMLSVNRTEHLIYSWDYGLEIMDLIGEQATYVIPELERKITECLLQDDRINAVDSFELVQLDKNKVAISFIVHSIYGEDKIGINL